MKIIMLGAPGSGKGTQAQRIAKDFKIANISTGDIFRENIRNQTKVGLEAKSYIDRGKLVPDEVTCKIVKERLEREDCKEGYLLDRFPRNIVQAQMLEAFNAPDAVLYLETEDSILLERISGRRVCKKCMGTFHISAIGDTKICPQCGGELYRRDDDNPATVSSRLDVYHRESAPLAGYFRERGILHTIKGNAPQDEVYENIKNILVKLA